MFLPQGLIWLEDRIAHVEGGGVGVTAFTEETEWGEQGRGVEVGVGWGWGPGGWDGFEASSWAASLAGIKSLGGLWKMNSFQNYQENLGFLLAGCWIPQISL